jgi:hypothetical protein
MDAIRLEQVVAKDGQLTIMGLPFKRGEMVEVIVLPQRERSTRRRSQLTVGQLRRSGLIGLWEDRDDIEDSSVYARRLREQAEHRGESRYDCTG